MFSFLYDWISKPRMMRTGLDEFVMFVESVAIFVAIIYLIAAILAFKDYLKERRYKKEK